MKDNRPRKPCRDCNKPFSKSSRTRNSPYCNTCRGRKRECACGCGILINKSNTWVNLGHRNKKLGITYKKKKNCKICKKSKPLGLKVICNYCRNKKIKCFCGCGKFFKSNPTLNYIQTYIHGHNFNDGDMGWGKSISYRKITYKSKLEVSTAKLLYKHKQKFKYEKALPNTTKLPDFTLPNGLLIEVSGASLDGIRISLRRKLLWYKANKYKCITFVPDKLRPLFKSKKYGKIYKVSEMEKIIRRFK